MISAISCHVLLDWIKNDITDKNLEQQVYKLAKGINCTQPLAYYIKREICCDLCFSEGNYIKFFIFKWTPPQTDNLMLLFSINNYLLIEDAPFFIDSYIKDDVDELIPSNRKTYVRNHGGKFQQKYPPSDPNPFDNLQVIHDSITTFKQKSIKI